MPVCFSLYPLNSDQPRAFVAIDEELCKFFEVPCDPEKYLWDWYSSIGFRLATGKSFEQIRIDFTNYMIESPEDHYYRRLIKVVNYLARRYTSNAWREVG